MIKRVALLAIASTLVSAAVAGAQGQRGVDQGPAPNVPRTLRAAAAIDLAGTWVSVVTEDWRWRMMTPPRYDYAAIPLNAYGRQVADDWDPAADAAAGLQCKVYGAAAGIRNPGRLNISWVDGNALQIQLDAGTQTRVLRHGARPAAGEPTWQGQSSAVWEFPESSAPGASGGAGRGGRGGRVPTGMLKVVTTNMRAGYLRKNGVPYSEKAVLTEYFVRTTAPNGDTWLVVTSIVDDPMYLNEPFVTSTHFKKEPDNSKFAPTPCVAHK